MWNELFEALKGGATKSGFLSPETGAANWDRIGQTLGMAGAAVSPPGSWQQNLGLVGAQMGKSNIYAKASDKVRKERMDFLGKILGDFGMPTGTEEPGLSKIGMDSKGWSVTGNYPTGEVPGVGPEASVGGMPKSAITLGGPEALPTGTGAIDDRTRAAIEALGNFRGSSAGLTSADLAGLDPREINALLSQEMQGERTGLDTARVMKELMAPEASQLVKGEKNWIRFDARGNSIDTGVPTSQPQPKYQKPTIVKSADKTFGLFPDGTMVDLGVTPYHAPITPPTYGWEGPKDLKMYDKKGNLYQSQVPAKEFDAEVKRLEGLGYTSDKPKDLSRAESKMISAKNIAFTSGSDEAKKVGIDTYNDLASDDSIRALIWNTNEFWHGDRTVEVQLPKTKDGRQVTMKDVRTRAKANGITVSEYIDARGWAR